MIERVWPQPSGSLDDEALEDAYRWPAERWVRLNFIAALDGAVEIEGRSGPLGVPSDRRVFHALRALADVVVVGSGTATTERYGPVRPGAAARERRRRRGQRPVPPLAVLSDRGLIDPSAQMFAAGDGPRPLVFTSTAASSGHRRALADVAEVVVAGEGRVDPRVVLDVLGQRGLGRVLCEGGPTILARLAAAGALDELCLTHAPVLAGPGRVALTGTVPHQPWPMALHQAFVGDGVLLACYRPSPADPTPAQP